jgi:membrane-associated phospholipid phosphatase
MSDFHVNNNKQGGFWFFEHPWLVLVAFLLGVTIFLAMAANLVFDGPLLEYDQTWGRQIFRFYQNAPDWFHLLVRVAAAFGMYFIVLVGVGLFVYWWRNERWYSLSMLTGGVLGGFLAFLIVGLIFGRARPDYPGVQHSWLPTPAFPSGHVLSSVTFYGLLMYLYAPRIRRTILRMLFVAIVLVVILGVGASRLLLAKHFPSDVIAAYGFGLAWGALAYYYVERYFVRHPVQDVRDLIPLINKR